MFTWPLASSRVHVSSGWRRDAGQIDDNLCSDLSRTIQRAHYKAEIHNRKAKLWGRRAYHRTVRISCIFFLLRILTKAGFTLKVWNAQSDFFSIYICSKMYEMQFPWGCSDNGCRKHRWITSECLFCFFLWLLLFFFFFQIWEMRRTHQTLRPTACPYLTPVWRLQMLTSEMCEAWHILNIANRLVWLTDASPLGSKGISPHSRPPVWRDQLLWTFCDVLIFIWVCS